MMHHRLHMRVNKGARTSKLLGHEGMRDAPTASVCPLQTQLFDMQPPSAREKHTFGTTTHSPDATMGPCSSHLSGILHTVHRRAPHGN